MSRSELRIAALIAVLFGAAGIGACAADPESGESVGSGQVTEAGHAAESAEVPEVVDVAGDAEAAGEHGAAERGEHAGRGDGREGGEHADGVARGEHADGGEGGEHGDGGEHGEGGEHSEGGDEDEESGALIARSATWDAVRRGARLVLRFDATRSAFVGHAENTTDATLCGVRVEVHMAGGSELGPTERTDVRAGESIDVELPTGGEAFEMWTAHPEMSACGGA